MAMEFTSGLTQACTKAIGSRTRYPAMESIPGTMGGLTKDIGSITICTDKEYINGLMAENTRASTSMTKNMASAPILIQTVDHTRDSGLTESSMERESL